MAVVRVDASGALDPGFGSRGVVTLPAGMQSIAQAIAIRSDGSILVAGGVFVAPDVLDYDFRVARLLSDGQLHTSFGTDGVVVTPAAGTIGATSLAVQPDGKILVGGDGRRRPKSSNRDFVVCRYLADGSPDTSFGSGGRGRSRWGACSTW